jgi:hypothetical protein
MAALAASQGTAGTITPRSAVFKAAVSAVSALFRERRSTALDVAEIKESFSGNADLGAVAVEDSAFQTLLQLMTDQDKLYISEGVAYLV